MENKIKIMKNGGKLKFAALIAAAAVAAAGGFYFLNTREGEIQYKTVPVVRSDLRSTIQATGTLNPVETVDVGTQISGTIKELYFDYNSRVKQGQLIAIMDSATQSAEVAQAQATVASAQADVLNAQAALDVAAKDLARTRELAKRDLIAKADVDADTSTWLKAKANLAAAEAKVAQYRATLEKSRINLNYTRIYSPVDGVVVAKNVEEGQTVAASYQTPSIAEIARDLTQMQVEVNVDEADIGGVHEGQPATFNVDTYPTLNFEGKVTQVRLSPETTDNVVTYTVIVKVQNPDGKLLPGMTANVSLILENRDDVLVVPNSAFRFKPSNGQSSGEMGPPGPGGGHKQNVAEVTKPALYTLDKKKKPVKIEVEKGITDGQNTEIISGVEEGERVITGIIVPKEEK
ncbi:efflux RND transporter periplasmic adaptor subunit [Cloacibacillus evryensis]|uniref:Efflux RND transporter periplasmic adaptor subunit n=1 Tax=Cloacibacillus evryensis TaxID=508460 RepID=A0AAW5K3X0_9BACT|nr:efflux RND transporter periplasmic adaptor subunit [Cloacibacillus evryensis]EHL64519.1 efflux transporter, RND family, MFP subunit [Synergistes sp. 3_1_syn1]MCQ4762952.1 efflux RND transporter periplasmic adaptor subunit [Cloacibacillus evryensis]MCQ4813850.1 efflux RND transporter periplasmic adaptor subunit [Cloacibacillus evryensis]MEA5035267.1 efflux RND transporter periplasmic adaptor subunit [Cloacibacillus evryensis]